MRPKADMNRRFADKRPMRPKADINRRFADKRPMRPKADSNRRFANHVGHRPRRTWVLKQSSDVAEGQHEQMKMSLRRPSATSDAGFEPKASDAAEGRHK